MTRSARPTSWRRRTASCWRWTSRRCCCRPRSASCRTRLVLTEAIRARRGARLPRCGTSSSTSSRGRRPHGDHRELPARHGGDAAGPAVLPAVGDDSPRRATSLTVLTMPASCCRRRRCRASTGRRASRWPCRCCTSRPGTRRAPSTAGARRSASSSRSTRRTSWASGAPAAPCSPGSAVTPASGTPACSPRRRTRPTCSAWRSRTSSRRRSSAGSRTSSGPRRAADAPGADRCRLRGRARGSLVRDGQAASVREFVMRDVDGNVDRLCVDLTANPSLLAALDTTARPAEGEERVA